MELLIIFLAFWIGFASLVGRAAKSRGRDYASWFVLALFTSPLVAAIFLMAFGPNTPPVVAVEHNHVAANTEIQALTELSELRQKGMLSDTEFEREKEKIIGTEPTPS